MWDMTHSCVYTINTCETGLIEIWDSYVIWLILVWTLTHSYAFQPRFRPPCKKICTCQKWLIHMSDMTHSYVRHDSFICETWLIHMRDHPFARGMTRSCVAWRIHMRLRRISGRTNDVRGFASVQHTAPHCTTMQHTAPHRPSSSAAN